MLQSTETVPVVPKEIAAVDSVRSTLHDSLQNIQSLSDVK